MRPVRGGAMRSRSSGRMTYSSPSSPARARGPVGGSRQTHRVSRASEASSLLSVSKALFTCVCERAVGARGGVLALLGKRAPGLGGLGWFSSLLFRPRAPLQVFAALSRRVGGPSGGRKPSASTDRVLGVGGRPRVSQSCLFFRVQDAISTREIRIRESAGPRSSLETSRRRFYSVPVTGGEACELFAL